MNIKVKKLFPDSKLPTLASPGSACFDVYSIEHVEMSPNRKRFIHTGLAFELPEDVGMDIRPRSGLASQGLIMLNSPGTLDSDYRGELLISCMNLSVMLIIVLKGERIAQIRLFHLVGIQWEVVDELSETKRGEGGFGSTGK